INAALDEFTLMKILSRIEGDSRSIGNLFEMMATVITADYPKSYEKLANMAKTLKEKQFVSYWT
ncbi:MAG: ATPase, partial [Muribaculaceae bacterium]|nr:ATPase [Muribaculaceae bacterium]